MRSCRHRPRPRSGRRVSVRDERRRARLPGAHALSACRPAAEGASPLQTCSKARPRRSDLPDDASCLPGRSNGGMPIGCSRVVIGGDGGRSGSILSLPSPPTSKSFRARHEGPSPPRTGVAGWRPVKPPALIGNAATSHRPRSARPYRSSAAIPAGVMLVTKPALWGATQWLPVRCYGRPSREAVPARRVERPSRRRSTSCGPAAKAADSHYRLRP